LPLVSMGGTSLLFTSASFGMILSVSHTFSEEGEREEKEKLKMAAQGINEEEENEEN
ncbi:MAG TPA: cell cycle protein, partial [Butyricimonas virosa]|nr:cell cycle protein [Butyricimonas virosa]